MRSGAIALTIASVALCGVCSAADITWDGGGSDDWWHTPANWSGDVVPTAVDDVFFDATSDKPCTIASNTTLECHDLNIHVSYGGQISGVPSSFGDRILHGDLNLHGQLHITSAFGLHIGGGCTITGGALSLTGFAFSADVIVAGPITISGGAVDASLRGAGNVSITGGSATGSIIFVSGQVDVSGGSCDYDWIWADGGIQLSAGSLVAPIVHLECGSLTVTGGAFAGATGIWTGGDILLTGGTAHLRPDSGGSPFPNIAQGGLLIDGCAVTVEQATGPLYVDEEIDFLSGSLSFRDGNRLHAYAPVTFGSDVHTTDDSVPIHVFRSDVTHQVGTYVGPAAYRFEGSDDRTLSALAADLELRQLLLAMDSGTLTILGSVSTTAPTSPHAFRISATSSVEITESVSVSAGGGFRNSGSVSVLAGATLDCSTAGSYLNEGLIVEDGVIVWASNVSGGSDPAGQESLSLTLGDDLYATVLDADENLDATAQEGVVGTVTNLTNGDVETISLDEVLTGAGEFRNTIGLSTAVGAATPGNSVLEGHFGDAIELRYEDDEDSTDVSTSLLLASIPDCNMNSILDADDIALGTSQDCNLNGVPDECEVTASVVPDCNTNGIPDECEGPFIDVPPLDTVACPSELISLSVSATGTAPLSYQWRKGGIDLPGETDSTLDVTISTQGDAGSFDVVVTGPCDSVVSDPAVVTLVEPPVLTALVADVDSGHAPLTVQLSATVDGEGDISWTSTAGHTLFGDPDATLVFDNVGVFDVEVTVTNGCGTTSQQLTITVCPTVSAGFDITQNTVLAEACVDLIDTTTGPVATRLWDFGDGTSSTDSNPTKQYAVPGEYTISLTVTGSCGGSFGASDTVTILGIGDANGDLAFDLADAIFTLTHLFGGGPPPPCERTADVNGDGSVNIGDAVYSLQHLFGGGPIPVSAPPCTPCH